MKAELTANAVTRILYAVTVLGCYEISIGQADILEGQAQESQEIQEEHYEWSVWSPCSRTCGTGIQFRGQLCVRENKVLCVKQPRKYQTCNTQACPPGSPSFRDAQCSLFNGREIFVNGQKARWISYVRGDNHCLLFCYPYGGELFYYFGKAKDGTPCSKEPDGVCVRGRCKPVGCDKRLESGVVLDKCRLCGGNSTKCKPMRGSIKRLPSHFEKMSGYAELMVIPKGSTSVLLKDTTSNYLGVKRQNGEYVVNGHRIINWSGWYNVNGVELRYKRFKDNIKETIEIFGPTSEDVYVTSLLISGKLNTTFEYWKPIRAVNVNQDEPEVKFSSQLNFPASLMEWGKWTACSSSCGGGIQVRARGGGTVSYFRERETQVKKCNDMPCDKMMAQWSVWGQWNDCSTSCGGGARIRFRYCKKPRGGAGEVNSRCSGERYAVELCNVEECPTEGTRSSTSEIADNKTASLSEILLVPTSPVISTSGKASEFSKTFQTGSASFSFPIQDVQKQKATIKPWDSSYSVTGYELSTREKLHSANVSLNFTVEQEASKSVPKAATAHASASVTWTSKSIGGDQFVIKTSFLSSIMEDRDRDTTLASMDKNTEFLALKPHSAIALVQTYPKVSSMEILESETKTSKKTRVLLHTVPSYSTVGNSQMRPFFLHLKSTQGTINPTLQTLKTYQQESSLASAKEPLYLSIDESTDSQFNETIAKPFVLQTSTLIAFTKPNLSLAPSPSQSFNLTRAIEATLHEYTSSRSSTQASLARRFSSAAFKTPALVSTKLTAEISSLSLTSVLGSSTNTNEKIYSYTSYAESNSPSSVQRSVLSPSAISDGSLSKEAMTVYIQTPSTASTLLESTTKEHLSAVRTFSKSLKIPITSSLASSSLKDEAFTRQNDTMSDFLSPWSSPLKLQGLLTAQLGSPSSVSVSKINTYTLRALTTCSAFDAEGITSVVESGSMFSSIGNAVITASTTPHLHVYARGSSQSVLPRISLRSSVHISSNETMPIILETPSVKSSSRQLAHILPSLRLSPTVIQKSTKIHMNSVSRLPTWRNKTKIGQQTLGKNLLSSYSKGVGLLAKEGNVIGHTKKDFSAMSIFGTRSNSTFYKSSRTYSNLLPNSSMRSQHYSLGKQSGSAIPTAGNILSSSLREQMLSHALNNSGSAIGLKTVTIKVDALSSLSWSHRTPLPLASFIGLTKMNSMGIQVAFTATSALQLSKTSAVSPFSNLAVSSSSSSYLTFSVSSSSSSSASVPFSSLLSISSSSYSSAPLVPAPPLSRLTSSPSSSDWLLSSSPATLSLSYSSALLPPTPSSRRSLSSSSLSTLASLRSSLLGTPSRPSFHPFSFSFSSVTPSLLQTSSTRSSSLTSRSSSTLPSTLSPQSLLPTSTPSLSSLLSLSPSPSSSPSSPSLPYRFSASSSFPKSSLPPQQFVSSALSQSSSLSSSLSSAPSTQFPFPASFSFTSFSSFSTRPSFTSSASPSSTLYSPTFLFTPLPPQSFSSLQPSFSLSLSMSLPVSSPLLVLSTSLSSLSSPPHLTSFSSSSSSFSSSYLSDYSLLSASQLFLSRFPHFDPFYFSSPETSSSASPSLLSMSPSSLSLFLRSTPPPKPTGLFWTHPNPVETTSSKPVSSTPVSLNLYLPLTNVSLTTLADYTPTWSSRTLLLASSPQQVTTRNDFLAHSSLMSSILGLSMNRSAIVGHTEPPQLKSSIKTMASLLSFDVNAQVKEEMVIESTRSARSTLLRLKTSTTVATSYTSAFQSFPSKERKNVFSKLQTLKPKEFAQEPLSTLGSSLRASPNTPVVTPTLTTDDSEFTVASSNTEQKTVSNVTETFGMFSLVSKACILKAVTGSLKSATGKEGTTTSRAVKTRSFKPTATKEGLLQTTSTVHEAKQWCGPCEHRVTRKRAYCSSDIVVHVQVISEGIDDPSLDRKYRVKVIRPFKISSDVSEVRTVWIRNDSCQCHLLIPEKRYLLMGQLTTHEGSTKTINGIELGRDSYVEEWRESMIRRILEIKKRGCLRIPTSQTPKVAITPPSEGKCPPCRISKKRNRIYCQSDFVIKARVIASSFDSISRERTYVVKIITVYRSPVKIRKRQEIHVQNDDCHCPYLSRGQLYVIMGTAERISRTEVRLMIPPRPFVRLWDSNMHTKYRSLSGICDK